MVSSGLVALVVSSVNFETFAMTQYTYKVAGYVRHHAPSIANFSPILLVLTLIY
jgi:hypothetical protein